MALLVGSITWLAYLDVRYEARELFDAQLAQSAREILSLVQADHDARALTGAQEAKLAETLKARVGKDVKMPWQVDGRQWHLEQRQSRAENATKWEPQALEYVFELIHNARKMAFPQTTCIARASVEVTAPGGTVTVGDRVDVVGGGGG